MSECEYVPSQEQSNGRTWLVMACKLCGQIERPMRAEPRLINARAASLALGVPLAALSQVRLIVSDGSYASNARWG